MVAFRSAKVALLSRSETRRWVMIARSSPGHSPSLNAACIDGGMQRGERRLLSGGVRA